MFEKTIQNRLMSLTPEREGPFSSLTTPSTLYIGPKSEEDADSAWSTIVRLMFRRDKMMANYSLELILRRV